MLFNGQKCQVLICRDLNKIRENAKLSADNKMLQLYSSSMSHELLTPLKCMSQIAIDATSKPVSNDVKNDLNLI